MAHAWQWRQTFDAHQTASQTERQPARRNGHSNTRGHTDGTMRHTHSTDKANDRSDQTNAPPHTNRTGGKKRKWSIHPSAVASKESPAGYRWRPRLDMSRERRSEA
mmetsp:Transcript_5049/g.11807  ORF Transcript_5049/g.11807 Transcript_5049/m.11807 type:complete len:106 (-) Transcript_5049:84-401(-)